MLSIAYDIGLLTIIRDWNICREDWTRVEMTQQTYTEHHDHTTECIMQKKMDEYGQFFYPFEMEFSLAALGLLLA